MMLKIQPPRMELCQIDYLPTFLLNYEINFMSKPRKNFQVFLHFCIPFWHYFDIPNDNVSYTCYYVQGLLTYRS